MKLQQLRFLDAVVRNNLNVSAAAEELYTSQPGVSHQIKLLEDELDIQIFERSGKKLTAISPAGHAILEHVTDLLNSARNIKRAAREYSKSNRGSLTIATTHTQAQFILPPIMQRFSNKYPHIELRVHQGNPKSMCKLAANNQVDFVIASEVIDERGELVTIPAYRWNRYIVVPPNHELTRIKDITLSDLASHPILTYMLGLTGRSQLDKTFQHANLEPRVAFTATDSDVIKTYVRLGMGAGIIAEMAWREDDSDLVYIDASHLFPDSMIKIGFRHSRHISAYQFDFLHMVAPHIAMETIREVAASRSVEEREELLRQAEVPNFREMRNTLKALRVVAQA
ncbi:MAG: LysR family transcriptional regulator [Gammaproteobacteria bacterium]|nr:MAG: LysR family transcriptional regulator [Gammaproteobacteria bacterium]UCH39476.1 MAG: LysR family transcriptional regulator [Gammaproteobacteria bacterium]